MSGGTKETSQTTQTILSKDQEELMKLAMPGIKSFAANPPQLPDYSRVAGFDPLQTQGQSMALGAAGSQQALASGGAQSQAHLMNPNILDPNSNPALRATIDAATRPITDQLLHSTLPNIRSGFTGAGQYGGSRQGIAEGLASRSASQAVGDTSAKVATEGYQSGLDAMSRSLGMLPSTMGAMTTPALTTSGVGDVRQAQAQALLGEKAGDFNYNQLLPYLVSSDIISAVQGIPGAKTQTTATGPQGSAISSALGGASLGASLGGLPGAAIGGGLMGLLSMLGL